MRSAQHGLLGVVLVAVIHGRTAPLDRKAPVFRRPFFPTHPPEWKDKLNALIPIIGLPVAFWIWHWRDRNVQEQIENQRKDVNLKEFEEVQTRAAGAFGKEVSEDAREQLQIAALQQLRAFIRGDYGNAFRRPAFELLWSGHATAMKRIGTHQITAWAEKMGHTSNAWREIQKAIKSLRDNLDPVSQERIWIIRDEWQNLVKTGFPLHHRNYDLLDLQGIDFSELILYHSSFVGTRLGGCKFTNTKIWSSNLIGAHLIGCEFDGADLSSTRT